jgi:hypothetical protein
MPLVVGQYSAQRLGVKYVPTAQKFSWGAGTKNGQ